MNATYAKRGRGFASPAAYTFTVSATAFPTLFNPLIVKGYRERLRLKHVLTWGVVVIVVAGFIYAIAFFLASNQGKLQATDANAIALAALLVLQAIILMLIGTGSVATGIVQERSARVLDYQRMTPMSPTSKIIGYLFGLPAREYFLAALVFPYIIVAALASDVSLWNLTQLYIVGLISVWLYHMMGMVAGIVAPRPWKAGVATQAMVLITYFVLPLLGQWGFTFFLYLTPRPVFAKLALEELNLPASLLSNFKDIPTTGDVPFFAMNFDPMVFTLLVQSFLIVSLFVIVYRKWRQETRHPFSKIYALLFYAGVQIGLLGSLWPWITDPQRFKEVSQRLENMQWLGLPGSRYGDVIIGILLSTFLAVSGGAVLLMANMITPDRHTYARGIRQAKKLGLPRNPWTNDAADATPYMAAFVLMTAASYTVFVWLAVDSGRFFTKAPSAPALALPILIFAGLAMYLQGIASRWGKRGLTMGLFLVWIVPFLLSITIIVAKQPVLSALYVGASMPVMSLMYCITYLFDGLMSSRLEDDMVMLNNAGPLTFFTLGVNTLLAVVTIIVAQRHLARIRRQELKRAESEDDASTAPVAT